MPIDHLEKIREQLATASWEQAVDDLRHLDPAEAENLIFQAPFGTQQEIFRRLDPGFAAGILGKMPYYHAYGLLHSRPVEEMREIVAKMQAYDRNCFLDELPEEAWQHLMEELGQPNEGPGASVRPAMTETAAPTAEKKQAAPAPTVAPALPEKKEIIVQARAVEKSFRQPEGRDIQVIAATDLSLESGTITALLGPSGSGKSTLLRMLSGLTQPTKGEVFWHGKPMAECSPNVAIVFQSFALFPWLSVQENVETPLLARGMGQEERRAKALRALTAVGLKGFETAYPKELSGGMKQRVGFARALAVEPEILFMDEPFSALDVLTAENLRSELLDLWEAKKIPTRSIFLVTHNIEEAVLLADRIIVLGRNPARIRADFRVGLAQPRDRKSGAFLTYVDYIYKVMTQPELKLAPPSAADQVAKAAPQMLPHARPGGIRGLLELLIDRGGEEDMYHVAEDLKLEVDDLLPIIDASALLGFAKVDEGDVKITPEGREFGEAEVHEQKRIFREAALAHVNLLQQIVSSLEKKSDHTMPLDFFHDLLDEHFSERDATAQLETAVTWGRWGEIFTYDPETERVSLIDSYGASDIPERAKLYP